MESSITYIMDVSIAALGSLVLWALGTRTFSPERHSKHNQSVSEAMICHVLFTEAEELTRLRGWHEHVSHQVTRNERKPGWIWGDTVEGKHSQHL